MAPRDPTEPVLALEGVAPNRKRPFITIDGASYRFRDQMDLNLIDLARFDELRTSVSRMAKQARTKAPRRGSDKERSKRLHAYIAEAVRLVMFDAIPEDLLAGLNDIARLAIVDAFTRATARAASQSQPPARPDHSTSPISSPASPTPITATPGTTG